MQLDQNESLKQFIHIEQNGYDIVGTSAQVGRVVQYDKPGELKRLVVTLGIAVQSEPVKRPGRNADIGHMLKLQPQSCRT